MYNPFRPSWGEPYEEVVGRMIAAVHDAAARPPGHEAVVVSHQLPIWTTRLFLEGALLPARPQASASARCAR
jgi:broad specificity phosphatase PhoE